MRRPNKLIRTKVDIYSYPQVDPSYPADPENQFTNGDLHANPIKALYTLIRLGVLTLGKQDYLKLVEIFRTADTTTNLPGKLTPEQLAEYRTILSRIQFNKNTVGLVRYIGDEFADRCSNDLLVKEFFDRLASLDVPYESLLSNHTMDFIKSCEREDFPFSKTELRGTKKGKTVTHSTSKLALGASITEGLVTRQDIVNFYNQVYKPHSKLLSYSFSPDDGITIYSHGIIGIDTIDDIVNQLNALIPTVPELAAEVAALKISYRDNSRFELAETIDDINRVYSALAEKNKIHLLCTDEETGEGLTANPTKPALTGGVQKLLWNRRPDDVNRPKIHKGYSINYVHGHDGGEDKTRENIYNTDTSLGKFPNTYKGDDYNEGRLNVLYSQEKRTLRPLIAAIRKQEANPALKDQAMAVINKTLQLKLDAQLETKIYDYLLRGLKNPRSINERELNQLIQILSPSPAFNYLVNAIIAFTLTLTAVCIILGFSLLMTVATPPSHLAIGYALTKLFSAGLALFLGGAASATVLGGLFYRQFSIEKSRTAPLTQFWKIAKSDLMIMPQRDLKTGVDEEAAAEETEGLVGTPEQTWA